MLGLGLGLALALVLMLVLVPVLVLVLLVRMLMLPVWQLRSGPPDGQVEHRLKHILPEDRSVRQGRHGWIVVQQLLVPVAVAMVRVWGLVNAGQHVAGADQHNFYNANSSAPCPIVSMRTGLVASGHDTAHNNDSWRLEGCTP
jgi:hypothetical protein